MATLIEGGLILVGRHALLYDGWYLHGHQKEAEVCTDSDICAVQSPFYREVRVSQPTLHTEGESARASSSKDGHTVILLLK